ncbi:bifunctional glycosyltransferase/class I SAM-dependent methyltransferase [Myxococcota bacterium]|nr:bifunctional glycosyltransferase/class I SAM-dependent methyltransferase [Myxococcota bacterium]
MKDKGPPEVDADPVLELERRRAELAGDFPRIALCLFQWGGSEVLGTMLARIPPAVVACLQEVVVVQEAATSLSAEASEAIHARGRALGLKLSILRQPRDHSFGGARKAAFEFATGRDFDHVITMRGDGLHPPEALPGLLNAALSGPPSLCVAARVHRLLHRPPGLPLARMVLHRVATGLQNRLLGLGLEDYHSGYRIYPVHALRRIPFQLDANERVFDTQMVIQCRALGLPIKEVDVPPSWQEYASGARGLREVLLACAEAIDYRLHQLHVTRRGRYFVDRGVHYTLKQSPTGSHMQIVDAIEPGTRVLDLGCSQGLLARPLLEKGVRVVGVDSAPPETAVLADELEAYHARDLEEPLDLPLAREFDYVVISDVIEHLGNRVPLLREARKYLKAGGRLVISTPNVALWFYRLSLLVGRFEYGARGVLDETHVHLFTRATFRREVEKAGFHVLRERRTALPFEVVFESTGRSRLIRNAADVYHVLARAWPTMFAYQIIFEAEITTLDEDSIEHPSEAG